MHDGGVNPLETRFERALFAARWLLAPLYAAMVFAIIAILVAFARELIDGLEHLMTMRSEQAILLALSLIDLSLAGNLLLLVIFAGYESFVSRLHIANGVDRPVWLGTVDFSDLKLKVIAAIIAISAIQLLRDFLLLADQTAAVQPERLLWMVVIESTFVISGVLLALMDSIAARHRNRHPGS